MSLGAWAICDRCGFKYRDATLRSEWTNLRVCTRCFDPRPAWLDPPYIDPLEGMPVPDARFDPEPVFTDDNNPVEPGDL